MNGDGVSPETAVLGKADGNAYHPGDPRKRNWARIIMWTLLVSGAIVPVAAAVIPVWMSDEPRAGSAPQCALPTGTGPVACIDTPRDSDEVSRGFTVTGKLSNIPPDSHVWIATQVGNLVWPKQPELPVAPVFNVTVVEGGNPPGGTFSIVLLLVTPRGEQVIDDWLHSPGGLPGLSIGGYIGDMTPLATVSTLQLR